MPPPRCLDGPKRLYVGAPDRKGVDPASKRAEAEGRIRRARAEYGRIDIRFQPWVKLSSHNWITVVGEAIQVGVDEPVDFWAFWRDTMRFWRAWRASRRLTDEGQALSRRAWEAFESASQKVKW